MGNDLSTQWMIKGCFSCKELLISDIYSSGDEMLNLCWRKFDRLLSGDEYREILALGIKDI